MQTPEPPWQLAADDAARSSGRMPSTTGWQQLLLLFSHPACPAVLAFLALLGLLFAFQRVVSQAVEQGNQRRMATAAQVEGAWRCRLLPRGSGDRSVCTPVGDAQGTLASQGRDGPALKTAAAK